MASNLPRFIAFESYNKKEKYLGVVHDGKDKFDGYLELSAPSQYAKFEVVPAKGTASREGLVHIRSSENNKYWERTKDVSITGNKAQQHWITATADNPEEDRSKESCTLFKLNSVDSAKNTVQIIHVQSNCYLWLWPLPSSKDLMLASYTINQFRHDDVFKVIDWESLKPTLPSSTQPSSALPTNGAEMAPRVPSIIVLQSFARNKEYLGLVHNENKDFEGYLEFKEIKVMDPYTKFEVEPAAKDGNEGLVHLRNSENQKYLVRTKNLSITNNPAEQYWITATAQRKEEDQSKETCTLYRFITVDFAKKTFRIMHVQSGCYLCLWGLSWKHVVLANYKIFDHQSCDVFRVIDWEPLTLPKYVAFKGSNGKYLCVRSIQNQPYLQFGTDKIADPAVPCEIVDMEDGNIRIKSVSSGKFWRPINSEWILADSAADGALFRPVKVDKSKIALVNIANSKFCKRLTTGGIESCLSANIAIIDEHAELTLEEPVKKREIHDVKYNLDFALFPERRDIVVATQSLSNDSQQAKTYDLKLSYLDTKTSSWDAYLSIKSGLKASFIDIELPFMINGCLKLLGKFWPEAQWGEPQTTNTKVEVVYKVAVPPMTKVTVDLYASYAKYEIPCSFTQKDTLYNGSLITTEVERASYTGSNYYNFNFETKEEKLK